MNAPVVAKPKRLKSLRRIAWISLFIVGAFCLLWCVEYFSARAERDALFAQILERRESVWLEDEIERLLNDQGPGTGAKKLVEASKTCRRHEIANGFEDPGVLGENDDLVKKEHPEPQVNRHVEKRLRGSEDVLCLLEEAAKLPPGLITSQYQANPPMSLVPRVEDIRGIEIFLYWVSYDALARSDDDRAYRSIWLLLSLSKQLSQDPDFHGRSRQITFVHRSCEHLALCLAYAKCGTHFLEIDSELSRWDDGFRLGPALADYRAEYLSKLRDPKALLEDLKWRQFFWGAKDGWIPNGEKVWVDLLTSSLGRPTIMREQSRSIRLIDTLAPTIDNPRANWNKGEEAIDAFVAGSPFSHEIATESSAAGNVTPIFAHSFAAGLKSVGRIAPNAHRRLILARIALRLRHYYDTHGKFPPTLEEICDETMPKIRLDWFQNLPLIYQPRADGFILDVSPDLRPGPGFHLKQKETDKISTFGWDFKLKTIKQGAAK